MPGQRTSRAVIISGLILGALILTVAPGDKSDAAAAQPDISPTVAEPVITYDNGFIFSTAGPPSVEELMRLKTRPVKTIPREEWPSIPAPLGPLNLGTDY